ncbi:hypothetical protein F4680DRAFT_360163 [Xylaria scruposa]|nr:hypothetical protein F4680DRAFT_360163 [Xylaria scruposa]
MTSRGIIFCNNPGALTFLTFVTPVPMLTIQEIERSLKISHTSWISILVGLFDPNPPSRKYSLNGPVPIRRRLKNLGAAEVARPACQIVASSYSPAVYDLYDRKRRVVSIVAVFLVHTNLRDQQDAHIMTVKYLNCQSMHTYDLAARRDCC